MKTLPVLLAAIALLGGCASDGFMEGSTGGTGDGYTQSYYGDAVNPTYPDLYFGD